jgi:hypothetical protein
LKIEYRETVEFKKDLKKLTKRFPSLPDDIATVKKNAIELYHLHHIDNQSVFQINALKTVENEIYKLKKFACKSLKGKGVHSGVRLIYAYSLSVLMVDLIEIYYKGDRENEDRERIKKFLGR